MNTDQRKPELSNFDKQLKRRNSTTPPGSVPPAQAASFGTSVFENRLRAGPNGSLLGEARNPVTSTNQAGTSAFLSRVSRARQSSSSQSVSSHGATPQPVPTATRRSGIQLARGLGNKHFLLVGLGVLGAEIGTVAAQIVPFGLESFLMRIVAVALWAGIICASLSLGLFTAIEMYHRRPVFRPMKSLLALGLGAICGTISGATAQAAFNLTIDLPRAIHEYVFKPICWGIMGTLLGLCLTLAVPNLRRTVAAVAGATGGIFGGFGFLLSAAMIALLPGRMVGCGILAAALALAVSLAEVVFREAYLEIIWAPNETSHVSLGPQVVYVGGSTEDTIVIRGAKPRESGFVMENGRVEHLESSSGKRTALPNGTRLRVGAVQIEVHCK